jgi:hypothetical protein
MHPGRVAAILAERAVKHGFGMALRHRNPAYGRLSSLSIRQRIGLSSASRGIIEEGLTHEIWRLLFNQPEIIRTGAWRQFIRFTGPNIIVLDVTPEESLLRIPTKQAPGPINRRLARSKIGASAWLHAVDAYDAVLSSLADEPTLCVTVIKAGALSPEEVSDEIAAIVAGTPSSGSLANGE